MSSPRLTLRLCDATFRVVPFMVILVVLAPYLWPLDAGPTSGLNDIRTFQAPNVQFLSAEIRANGELPRWNPQDFAGIPLVGDPQAGVYNPVNWLLALRPTLNSFGWLIVVSAGCGAWGLLRLASAFGYSDAAAAVGASSLRWVGSSCFIWLTWVMSSWRPSFWCLGSCS